MHSDRRVCPYCHEDVGDLDQIRLKPLLLNTRQLKFYTTLALFSRSESVPIDPPMDVLDEAALASFEPPLKWYSCSMVFSNLKLQLAAGCVQNFVEKGGDSSSYWYSVTVPFARFNAFVGELIDCFVLPFYSGCRSEEGDHVHLTLVLPHHSQKRGWTRIRKPRQLIESLLRASQEHSGCTPVEGATRTNYVIHTCLPEACRWVLACVYCGGLSDLIHEIYEKLNLKEKFERAQMYDGKWFVSPHVLKDVPVDLVFPVSPEMIPASEETRHWLYMNTKKLYFEEDAQLTESKNWIDVQTEHGNTLAHFLEHCTPLELVKTEKEALEIYLSVKAENKALKRPYKMIEF